MEDYGFVYLWRDRKKNKYYVGCHWGNVADGYICSSKWMRDAYRYRPKDFKRRVIAIVNTNKVDLLEEEFKWLSQIGNSELGKKYYNLRNFHFSHWSTNDQTNKTVGAKISAKANRPEIKEAYSKRMKANNPMHIPGVAIANGLKQRGREPWNKGLTKELCPEVARRGREHSKKMKGNMPTPWNKGREMNPEYKTRMKKMQSNKMWAWNKKTDQMIHLNVNDEIPEGFVRGRRPLSEETKRKKSESMKKHWASK